MGLAGRQRVLARFTWSGVVQRCLEAYSGAVSHGQEQSRVAVPGSVRG